MGFWDFIAPDYEAFLEVASEVLPGGIAIGPVVLSQGELATLAWANPGSGAGLALRTYYSARQYGLPRSIADAVWSQINDQAAGGAFGQGPGVGGSFSWEARPVMPATIIPNVYRVAVEASCSGQPVTNVVGVRGASSGLADEAAAAVLAGWTAGPNAIRGALPLGYVLEQVTAMDLSSANGEIASVASAVTGTGTGQIATMAATALIKWNGGTRSRSSRGRMYLGPLTEPCIAANGRTLEPTFQSDLNALVGSFRASLTAAGFTLCVISPTLNQAFDIASHSVESVVATQRRRLR